MEVFSIEGISKNILIYTQYSHPSSKCKIFEKVPLKHVLTKQKKMTNLCHRQLEFKSTWLQSKCKCKS